MENKIDFNKVLKNVEPILKRIARNIYINELDKDDIIQELRILVVNLLNTNYKPSNYPNPVSPELFVYYNRHILQKRLMQVPRVYKHFNNNKIKKVILECVNRYQNTLNNNEGFYEELDWDEKSIKKFSILLSSKEKKIFCLLFIYKKSPKEISIKLGYQTASYVYKKISIIRKKFKAFEKVREIF